MLPLIVPLETRSKVVFCPSLSPRGVLPCVLSAFAAFQSEFDSLAGVGTQTCVYAIHYVNLGIFSLCPCDDIDGAGRKINRILES
jgi:hypothetical protein